MINKHKMIEAMINKVVIGRDPSNVLEEVEVYDYKTNINLGNEFEGLFPDWKQIVKDEFVTKYGKNTAMGKFMVVCEYTSQGVRCVFRWPLKFDNPIVFTRDDKGRPKDQIQGRKADLGEDIFYAFFKTLPVKSEETLESIAPLLSLTRKFVSKSAFVKALKDDSESLPTEDKLRAMAKKLGFRVSHLPTS